MKTNLDHTQRFIELALARLQDQRNQCVARLTATLECGGNANEIESYFTRIDMINALLVRIVAIMRTP